MAKFCCLVALFVKKPLYNRIFYKATPLFFDALLLPCVALFALNKKIPPTFFKSTELKFNLNGQEASDFKP